ncbi:MAG: hypothetical protein IVW55_07595, partial [Chloroflexi bacterium]|nr:hypothetical protein [Chloroflexota bacterium]
MNVQETGATEITTAKREEAQQQAAVRPKLLLVDGHALVYRAYHALPADLRTSRGEPTNAVLGFTQMLMDTLRKETPQYAVVTFDMGRTFRHEAAPNYKAQRGPMPGDLSEQFGRVRQVVGAMGLPIVELAGYEADDLIGTLSKEAEQRGLDTYILTADTDQHQLVSDHVYMIAPGGYNQRFSDARIYDKAAVQERYGFDPELVPDYKALVGDKTDNIPNVPTIGKETASKLLQKYGSLEGIIEHIDELKPKQQESLREHAEQALNSKELATIVCDAPVQLDLEHSHVHGFDRVKMLRLLQELEFSSLVGKVNTLEQVLSGVSPHPEPAADASAISLPPVGPHQAKMFDDEAPAVAPSALSPQASPEQSGAGIPDHVHVVSTPAALKSLAERLTLEGRFTVDVEATSPDDMDAQLVGIAVAPCSDDGSGTDGFYIPVGHLASGEGIAV